MKTVWKFLPAALYDLDGTQTWLEKQAARGLYLVRWGVFFCTFRRGEPKKNVRYRLDPVDPKDTSQTGAPSPEQIELYRADGWEYVCPIQGKFHIFSTEDPNAPELYTDAESLSWALRGLTRSAVMNLIFDVALALFAIWLLPQFMEIFSGPPALLRWGSCTFLLPPLFLLVVLWNFYPLYLLFRTKRALDRGQELPRSSPGRRALALTGRWLLLLALVLSILDACVFWGYHSRQTFEDPADLSLPLLSLAELEQQPSLVLDEFYSGFAFNPDEGTYAWSSPSFWSPTHLLIHWQGTVKDVWWKDVIPDHTWNMRYSPSLTVELWETRGSLPARTLWNDLSDRHFNWDSQETLELDWAEQAELFVSETNHVQLLILRDGSRTASISYHGVASLISQLPTIQAMFTAHW